MLAIKLKMVGRKNQRTFRVIVQEARSKLGGKFVEDLGWYNPHTNQYKINKNRVDYWLGNGAQPTETVVRILKKAQTSETETYEVREGRKKKKKAKATEGSLPDVGAFRDPSAEGGFTSGGKAESKLPEGGTPAPDVETPTEAPSEEAPAVEEAPAPILPQDSPKEQSSEEVGIEKNKSGIASDAEKLIEEKKESSSTSSGQVVEEKNRNE